MAYSPSSKQLEHANHCLKHNLILLSPEAIFGDSDHYYLVRINPKNPLQFNYFLKDFKQSPSPSNRTRFNEKQVWDKVFDIYKEFSTKHQFIKEEPKEEPVKQTKPLKQTRMRLPKNQQPANQIDLLDMIKDVESEQKEKEK